MSDEQSKVNGLSLEEWREAFRPGMAEFAASRFVFTTENNEQVRIAFGNHGPWLNKHDRLPVYTHAVTLAPDLAVELARLLLKHYAQPKDAPNASSAEA